MGAAARGGFCATSAKGRRTTSSPRAAPGSTAAARPARPLGTSCARDAGSTGASHIQRATSRDQTEPCTASKIVLETWMGIIWSFCCFFCLFFCHSGCCNVDHLSPVQLALCIYIISIVNKRVLVALAVRKIYLITKL